jgi:hypothetical protein
LCILIPLHPKKENSTTHYFRISDESDSYWSSVRPSLWILKHYQCTGEYNLGMSDLPTVKHYTQGHRSSSVVLAGGGWRSSAANQHRMWSSELTDQKPDVQVSPKRMSRFQTLLFSCIEITTFLFG